MQTVLYVKKAEKNTNVIFILYQFKLFPIKQSSENFVFRKYQNTVCSLCTIELGDY